MEQIKAVLKRPFYRRDIDGIRAIAVLSVVGFHFFPRLFQGGFVGVDIFFVISGFLISLNIFDDLKNNLFGFFQFYERRAKRILPALIVVLMFCYSFGWFSLLADEYKQLGKHLIGASGFISNFVLWSESGYFDSLSETKPLLHLWSLGIEEQFYLLWPFLLWSCWKIKLNFFLVTLSLLFFSLFLNIWTISTDSVTTFYFPSTRIWELLIGAGLAYRISNGINLNISSILPVSFKNRFSSLFSGNQTGFKENLLSFLGVFLILFSFIFLTKDKSFPGIWAVFPTVGTALVLAGGSSAWFNRKILAHKVLVWFGLISFPLYLWHWPLLSFIRIIEGGMPSRITRFAILFLSILLAWLTYRYIEKPIRFGSSLKFKAEKLMVLLLATGVTGFFIYFNEGFEFRGTIKNYANNKNELIRTPIKDDACLSFIHNKNPLFPYCRFNKAEGSETVAVIGDSHAHVAFPGIAELLKKKGISTVLLANSGCPPLIDGEYGDTQVEKKACRDKINQIIQIVESRPDIKKVFIFTRGTVYLTGKYYGDAEIGTNKKPLIQPDVFKKSLQQTINSLAASGKRVFYVNENPELPVSPDACISRPFRKQEKSCSLSVALVKSRQEQYLNIMHDIKNATIIDTLSAFCPLGVCTAFEDGALLYADFDHLSQTGSRFQAQKLLAHYLS